MALRFYMLAVFVWAGALQSTTWLPIVAAPAAAKRTFPGLTDAGILMQLNLGPIVQAISTPPAMALLVSARGLQHCIRGGVLFGALSAGLRLLAVLLPLGVRSAPLGQWLLHCASMACGVSGAFLQGAPSRFSAVWFPLEQRARATGCAFVGLGFGQALCYAVCPLLTHGSGGLTNLLVFQAALAVPPLLCCLAYLPDSPRSAVDLRIPPSSSLVSERGAAPSCSCEEAFEADTNGQSLWRMALAMVRQRSVLSIVIVCSLANGPYQAWSAALPTILGHFDFGPDEMDMLSLGSLLAYTIGCYLVGELGDRVFRRRFKLLILLLLLAALASFAWLCLMLPTNFAPQPPLRVGFSVVLLAVSLTGWFTGATNPICMELCAEMTYPLPEGISGNLILFVTQVCAIFFLFVVPLLSPLVATPMTMGIVALCVLLLIPVKAQYLRSTAEQCC